jgi:hypothetical protein
LAVPQKMTCQATGEGLTSRFAGKKLQVEIDSSADSFSIFMISNGKRSPFIQGDVFCGKLYKAVDVQRNCDEKVDGSAVAFSREQDCTDEIPGTDRSTMIYRTGFFVNSADGKTVNGATGEITCVVNENGFSSLTISGCAETP